MPPSRTASPKLVVEASRPVALGTHGAGADDDHIRKGPKNHKQAPVGRAPQRPGAAAELTGTWRSVDGGATWKRVLAGATATTGAVDLAIDPSNPQRIYAAMWDHIRYPDLRVYGGVPFAWTRHLRRLARSAEGLGLRLPPAETLRQARWSSASPWTRTSGSPLPHS